MNSPAPTCIAIVPCEAVYQIKTTDHLIVINMFHDLPVPTATKWKYRLLCEFRRIDLQGFERGEVRQSASGGRSPDVVKEGATDEARQILGGTARRWRIDRTA